MQSETEDLRPAILNTAKEVFRKRGYTDAAMLETIERLGGSADELRRHFPSNDDLFKAVLVDLSFETVEALYDGGYAKLSNEDDIVLILKELGMRYARIMLSDAPTAGYRLAITEGDRSDLGRRFYERGPHHFLRHLSEAMQQAIDNGILRQENPMHLAFHMKALYEAEICERRLMGVLDELSEADVVAIIDRAVRAFMRAYAIEYGVW